MKWNRFTVKTKTEAEDIVISTLAEVGIDKRFPMKKLNFSSIPHMTCARR